MTRTAETTTEIHPFQVDIPEDEQLREDLPRLCRWPAHGQSHPGPDRRQNHAVLADGHRGLSGPGVLGGRTSPSSCGPPGSSGGLDPGRLDDVSRRGLPGPAQLGPGRLLQPHLLQRGRQGRPLRGVGGAGGLLRRGASRIQATPLGLPNGGWRELSSHAGGPRLCFRGAEGAKTASTASATVIKDVSIRAEGEPNV